MEAELAILDDLEGAIRPYFQAIAQSDDNTIKLYGSVISKYSFRMGKFEQTNAYAKVLNFHLT